VVTSSLVFEGNGAVNDYVGGYTDWLRQRPRSAEPAPAPAGKKSKPVPQPAPAAAKPKPANPLSSNERKELRSLPDTIEKLEKTIAGYEAEFGKAGFYDKPADEIKRKTEALGKAQSELEEALVRWEALEARQG
jgi:ATP-binding cassette subfamily F protein uup